MWKTPVLGKPFVPPEVAGQGHRATTIDSWGINIAWGILSTPVIDREANRMYCANWMLQPNGKPALFVHRIDLSTMREIGAPEPIVASLGQHDVHGKPVELHPDQKQRAALLLVPLTGQHKTLFVATAGEAMALRESLPAAGIDYATKQAEDLPSEVAHIGSVNGDAQPERRSSADVLNPTGAVASGQ